MIEVPKIKKFEAPPQVGLHHFDKPNVFWTDASFDAGPSGDRHAIADAIGVLIEDIIFFDQHLHTNEVVIIDSLGGLEPYRQEAQTMPDGIAVKSAKKVLNWTGPLHPPEGREALGAQNGTYDGVILVGERFSSKLLLVTGADCTPVGVRGDLKSGEPFVSVVHGGRKGTMTGIVGNLAKRLQFLGVDLASVEAFVGPSAQRIEVPVSVLETESPDDNSWRQFVSEPYYDNGVMKVRYFNQLDTSRRLVEQLGISADQVTYVDIDTESDETMHSYRRDRTTARNSLIIGTA